MNDARYPNISAIDNRLAELENEKQQLLALREALRSKRALTRYSLQSAEYIHSRLTEMGISTVVLKSAMKAAERKNADNHLQSAQVVVATGKYVGKGFDLPRGSV